MPYGYAYEGAGVSGGGRGAPPSLSLAFGGLEKGCICTIGVCLVGTRSKGRRWCRCLGTRRRVQLDVEASDERTRVDRNGAWNVRRRRWKTGRGRDQRSKERTDAKAKEKGIETTKENPGGARNDVVRDGSGQGRS